ncbi:MAG: SoxR reducing system protein RseC [Bacteroidetes bacterium ADurb.Bin408]|nr:MAG: SoxR reducing system protein RseC [Bacteroidetes bacterium ADurb.Bin408]
MNASNTIAHKGTVVKSDENTIYVAIKAESACGSCHAKGFCDMGNAGEKIIEVKRTGTASYNPGEEVNVVMTESLGITAVLLAYVYPFIILFTVLILSLALLKNELFSGLLSIAVLVPYYFILYMRRDKLKKAFSFRID